MRELKYEIHFPDKASMEQSKKEWDSILKPLGSLGMFEMLVIRLAGIQKTKKVRLEKRCALIACADNGVVAEGVTQSDSAVTTSVALEIANGRSNINVLGNAVNMQTFAIDVGMLTDSEHPELFVDKLLHGTGNIAKEPAMTRKEAVYAIQVGIDMVEKMKERGYQIIVTGEMGIGNTTTSSALASVLLEKAPVEVTGRGSGLTTEGLQRKIHAIECAIQTNHASKEDDPISLLAKVGGLDIAAMTGMFLGGMNSEIPIIIDGFISSIAALLAVSIAPECREYMFASHMTEEPAGVMIMQKLGLSPVLHANMRLGEGTGAVFLLPLLDQALVEYYHAHRFQDTDVEQYVQLK